MITRIKYKDLDNIKNRYTYTKKKVGLSAYPNGQIAEKIAYEVLKKLYDKVIWISKINKIHFYDFLCIKNKKIHYVDAKSFLRYDKIKNHYPITLRNFKIRRLVNGGFRPFFIIMIHKVFADIIQFRDLLLAKEWEYPIYSLHEVYNKYFEKNILKEERFKELWLKHYC